MGLGVVRIVTAMGHLVIMSPACVCAALDILAPTAMKVSKINICLTVVVH